MRETESIILGEDATKGLIDRERLQLLQQEFCRVTGLCLYALDGSQNRLTEISGSDRQLQLARECIDNYCTEIVLGRVEEGSLEDQAIEILNNGMGCVAAIAVRADSDTILFWVVFLFNEDDRDESYFQDALDLLRDASNHYFQNKLSCYSAEAESRRSKISELRMGKSLHTIEATTAIVQLLDSDDRIEKVMEQWLHIMGKHLMVDSAQLFQLRPDAVKMDVICEWWAQGRGTVFDFTSGVDTPRMLKVDKPLVISANDVDCSYSDELEIAGLQAVMIFPVLRHENTGTMMLALNHRKQKHVWSVEEVKYTADAVKVMQSILTRRIQKNSLASSYEALAAILDNVGCSIYVSENTGGECLFANRMLQSTFARELHDNTFKELLNQGIAGGNDSGSYEIYHQDRNHWYDLIYKDISWVDGRSATLYLLYDITEKKLYQRKIEQQAYTDFLTGLYNRMCCERDLARQIDQAQKNHTKGAILYLDLDDFKHINDGLGHQYGDVLLKSISHSLQRVSGIENSCYRMGGDEFVIVVSPDSYPKFNDIVEDIKQIFAKPWYLKDTDYYCTMSMGIVTYPDLGDSVPDLIKKADIAMYEAKKSGKNRVARYSDGINSSSGRRLDMEKNMRDAAIDCYREFEVFYQPIIDIQQNKCVGAEALIRWNSPKLGFIPPTEFIPLAEYLGLINPIGNHVLHEACVQCKKWNDAGYDFKVNVNLSVVQLLQTDVVEIVERTLQETELNPKNLTLEVTESLAINDMERMKEILGRIKALGVKIALDDFGTGYSSLNHIREIPFDMIKVDQSFVKGLAEDAYSQSFVKMVAELAETLGVSICVEGIEQESQYLVVKDMKVKYIQGFYFDRPMKREEFVAKYLT